MGGARLVMVFSSGQRMTNKNNNNKKRSGALEAERGTILESYQSENEASQLKTLRLEANLEKISTQPLIHHISDHLKG